MRIVLFSFALLVAGCPAPGFPELPSPPREDAGASDESGAETWPPDGAFGVPPEPELLAVRTRDSRDVALTLFVDDVPIAFDSFPEECEHLGFRPGRCLRIELEGPLPDRGELRVEVNEVPASTMLLGADARELRLLETECAIFEEARGGFCLDVDDRSARIRATLDRSARVAIELPGERRVHLSPGGSIDALISLPAPCPFSAEVRVIALDGRAIDAVLPILPPEDLAPVHLVESLANPKGPEPESEYVELFNASDEPFDLGGFELTDSPVRRGDVIPHGAFIPAGGRLLLVPRGYEPTGGPDPSPPPGAPLVRLDASLANGGLANSGEPLFLLDRLGRRVSAMPAVATPKDGVCLLARSIDDRRPTRERFMLGPCTPGR